MTNKELNKIGKILSDTEKSKLKEFDIVFLIDATSSMSPYIEAAKSTAIDLSKSLRQIFPDTNFQYGYIFYRDPIDSIGDVHEIISLTDNVNSLPEIIGKIKAFGGADLPEDWAGAYKKVNEEIKWRNGTKVIFHLADAGAHGKLFTPYDKYPEEEQKLTQGLEICCEKKVKIFSFVIEEDARHSFEKCKDIYRNKGGFYEIYNFDKPKYTPFFDTNYCSGTSSSLFGNSGAKSLFGGEKTKELEINDDRNINNNTGLFVNNSNNLIKNKKDSNEVFSLFNNKENNNKTIDIFGNNNNSGGLFGYNNENNNNSCSLFGNNNKNNNNSNGLFGNNNENYNNSCSLFAKNNKKNNNSGGLFGNNNENNYNSHSLFGNNNENNNQGVMSYQSRINKSFFNLVFDSIQNVNKN